MRQSTLWPGRPILFHDEAFSSWLTRAAHSNGLSPKDLYSVCVPGTRLFQVDLDRFPDESLIKKLSAHTGTALPDITASLLSKFHGTVFADQPAKSRLLWIPPSNVSVRSFGQQICPQCLQEDKLPYIRHSWRLAFVTICPKHICLLSDRCQSCGKPISILKLSLNMKLNQCSHCGSFIEPNTDLAEEVEGQNTLLRIANGEWPKLGNKHLHPILYFRILSYAFRLIGCSRFSIGFQQELGQEVLNIPKFKDVERYNTRCRHALIQMSLKLLSNWPHNFIDICRCVGITRNRLLKVKFDLPFELQTQIDQHLGDPFFKITAEDIAWGIRTLEAKGISPTRIELEKLFNFRFSKSHKFSFKKSSKRIPSGQSRYWKLDGVSPEVKEAAKKAARRAGENIGTWVDNVLRKELKRRENG